MLDELLQKYLSAFRFDITKSLYHYTSVKTLEKIIENQNLWFIKSSSTSDNSEEKFSVDISRQLLMSLSQNNSFSMNEREILSFAEKSFIGTKERAFLFCLTTQKDDPYMWKNYASNGVSIEFDFSNRDYWICNQFEGQFYRVIYGKEVIGPFIENFVKEFLTSCNSYDSLKYSALYLADKLSLLSCFYKSEYFSAEKEVRCIYVSPRGQKYNIDSFSKSKKDDSSDTPLEFVAFPSGKYHVPHWNDYKEGDPFPKNKLPITSVTLVPGNNYADAIKQIKTTLEKNGYGDVPVFPSREIL